MIKLFTKKYRAVWLPVLFALGVLFLLIKPADPRNTMYTKINGAIDPHPELLIRKYDSCEQFRHIYDSLEKLSFWKAYRISPPIEKQLWWFGVTKLNECDSCYEIEVTEKNKLQFNNKYFFVLKDYTLGYNSFFKIEKGKYIVRNYKWEKTEDGAVGKPTDIDSKVRLVYNLDQYPYRESYLLVPVSKSLYNFFSIFIKIIMIPVGIFLLWAIIILPAKILYNIAIGKVFTRQNILNIRFSGWTIVIVILLPILLNWIIALVLGNTIPKGLYFPAWLYLNDNKGLFVTGIAFLLLGEAFKNGYRLQEEQELTI